MLKATRHLCLTVILALLVGHASYAVHAASHDGFEAADCQLCISYGNASAVAGDVPDKGVLPKRDHFAPLFAGGIPAVSMRGAVRPRGPPLSN